MPRATESTEPEARASTRNTHDGDDDSFQGRLTEEQKAIVNYLPQPGQVIRVNALAGAGKTTTIAILSHNLVARLGRLPQRAPARLLYIVFNKSAQQSARQSGKFPKDVEIMTSHAFAKMTSSENDRCMSVAYTRNGFIF